MKILWFGLWVLAVVAGVVGLVSVFEAIWLHDPDLRSRFMLQFGVCGLIAPFSAMAASFMGDDL